jgi:hypothetical protein
MFGLFTHAARLIFARKRGSRSHYRPPRACLFPCRTGVPRPFACRISRTQLAIRRMICREHSLVRCANHELD